MEDLTHTEEVQQLFIKNMGCIRGIIIGMVSDLALAEDVLQEVFMTVTRKAEDFELGTNFMAWVRSVVRLKVLELVRQKKRSPFLMDEEALDALASSAPVDDDDGEYRRKALVDCLKSVSPQARKILDFRYTEGLLPPRIAELVSWSIGAVHVQLTKTRNALRDCVQRKIALGGM